MYIHLYKAKKNPVFLLNPRPTNLNFSCPPYSLYCHIWTGTVKNQNLVLYKVQFFFIKPKNVKDNCL